ncbi:MAG: LysE family transporter [Burkholderiaceae bacterium]
MLTLFFAAALLGLIFNATPGPILAATIRFGIRDGFRPALAVQLGSLAGDALWALLGLAGVGLLLQIDWLRTPLTLAGIAYLLWLAMDAWRDASRLDAGTLESSAHLPGQAFRSGMILSVTNPQNLAYWAAIGSALGSLGVSDPSFTDYTVFFAGFMTSSVLWCFVCASLVNRLFSGAGVRWIRLATRSCAVAFVVLAILSMRHFYLTDRTSGPAPAAFDSVR